MYLFAMVILHFKSCYFDILVFIHLPVLVFIFLNQSTRWRYLAIFSEGLYL